MSYPEKLADIFGSCTLPTDKNWKEEMREKYPYFPIPEILLLTDKDNNLDEKEREEMLFRLSLACPDRNALYMLLGEKDAIHLKSFYPPEVPVQHDTYSTIDTFLDHFGNSDSKEIDILNNLIFNPAPDYAEILTSDDSVDANDVQYPKTENDILIDNFISKSNDTSAALNLEQEATDSIKESEIVDLSHDNEMEGSSLSESLAKIYIKQRKYSKALDILTNLDPETIEKNIYIADQIRFLKKLILIKSSEK